MYVSCFVQEEQEKIFYLTCKDIAACETNPVVEKFRKKDFEVLFFTETIDEYASQHIQEFDGVEPVNILRESAQLDESASFKKIVDMEETDDLIEWFKKVLGSKASR